MKSVKKLQKGKAANALHIFKAKMDWPSKNECVLCMTKSGITATRVAEQGFAVLADKYV